MERLTLEDPEEELLVEVELPEERLLEELLELLPLVRRSWSTLLLERLEEPEPEEERLTLEDPEEELLVEVELPEERLLEELLPVLRVLSFCA